MAVVFIDFAIDIPSHILLKMPKVKILSRDIKQESKTESKLKLKIDDVKNVEFKQLKEIDYINAFKPYLKSDEDVLYVSISSYFSRSVKRVDAVISELQKEFPKRKIIHIDTCNLSIASGYLAYYAYCLVEQNKNLDDIKKYIDNNKMLKYCFFIVNDLNHLKNSGKINENVLAGGVKLNVKPILTISPKGEIEKYSQVVGFKKALGELVNIVERFGKNVADHRVGIIYSGNKQMAFDLRNSLIEKFNIENNIDIVELNAQIAASTGDGVLGVVFNGKGVR